MCRVVGAPDSLFAVTSLRDFKANILGPLLRGEPVAPDIPLTLFAAALDDPLGYVFESDRWDEIAGAARRLAKAGDSLRAVLEADGYSADDLLHLDGCSVLALAHDQTLVEQWTEAIERAVAAETDLVTVSTLVYPVTTQQITAGLYGTPRLVLGVPGVNDYQERINRYYGLSSPSTIPKDEAILQRRHFGEVVALVNGLLARARESRQIVPFYESLAFAERCASCRVRPAEQIEESEGLPICGVCLRKRAAAPGGRLDQAGLVWLEAVGLDRFLEQQRSPGSYRHLRREIGETLHAAIPGRRKTTLLASGGGWLVLALPAPAALEAATEALEAISLHYGLQPPAAFAAAVALGTEPGRFRALFDLVQRSVANLKRSVEGTGCLLDVRRLQPDQPFDRLRKPYTIDEARRLLAGVAILRETDWPDDLLADLPEQLARGSAGLYTVFERSRLPEVNQQILKRLEQAWEAGVAPGPRFHTLLSDALALARLRE
jgi:hypothetical protein